MEISVNTKYPWFVEKENTLAKLNKDEVFNLIKSQIRPGVSITGDYYDSSKKRAIYFWIRYERISVTMDYQEYWFRNEAELIVSEPHFYSPYSTDINNTVLPTRYDETIRIFNDALQSEWIYINIHKDWDDKYDNKKEGYDAYYIITNTKNKSMEELLKEVYYDVNRSSSKD